MTYQNRYKIALKKKVELMNLRYEKCMTRRVFKEPLQKINEKAMSLDMLVKSIENSVKTRLNQSKARAGELIAKLDSLSPLKTLARGYNIAQKDNKVISKKEDISLEDILTLKFIDGDVITKVIEK